MQAKFCLMWAREGERGRERASTGGELVSIWLGQSVKVSYAGEMRSHDHRHNARAVQQAGVEEGEAGQHELHQRHRLEDPGRVARVKARGHDVDELERRDKLCAHRRATREAEWEAESAIARERRMIICSRRA